MHRHSHLAVEVGHAGVVFDAQVSAAEPTQAALQQAGAAGLGRQCSVQKMRAESRKSEDCKRYVMDKQKMQLFVLLAHLTEALFVSRRFSATHV